jgi:hypothetical protein
MGGEICTFLSGQEIGENKTVYQNLFREAPLLLLTHGTFSMTGALSGEKVIFYECSVRQPRYDG